MITTDFCSGRITGTRLRVEVVAPVYTWQTKRPSVRSGSALAFHMTDNSTDVSARKRRHL